MNFASSWCLRTMFLWVEQVAIVTDMYNRLTLLIIIFPMLIRIIQLEIKNQCIPAKRNLKMEKLTLSTSLFTKLQTTVNVVMLFLRIFYCVNFKKQFVVWKGNQLSKFPPLWKKGKITFILPTTNSVLSNI